MRALSTRNDDPKAASRPWDKGRDGFVLGEGAGIVVLEEYEHAKARGAKIYAELLGYGMSADAGHMTAPNMDGPRRAMLAALRNAGVNADQVDYLNAHGTSTPLGDLNETNAIKAAMGEHAKKLVVRLDQVHDRPFARWCWRSGERLYRDGLEGPEDSSDHQSGGPGSGMRSGLLRQHRARCQAGHRRQEQLWFWRYQRHPGVQTRLMVVGAWCVTPATLG